MVVRKKKATRAKAKKAAPKSAKREAENPKNLKMHTETLKRMKKELKDALNCFFKHAPKGDHKTFLKDATRLKLLFGECKFMANEYKKLLPAGKRKGK